MRAALGAFPAGAVVPGEPELVLAAARGDARCSPGRCTSASTWRSSACSWTRTRGAIAHRYSDLQTDAVAGIGHGVWADRKKLSVDADQGSYRTRDRLRPPSLVTYDLHGDIGAPDAAC